MKGQTWSTKKVHLVHLAHLHPNAAPNEIVIYKPGHTRTIVHLSQRKLHMFLKFFWAFKFDPYPSANLFNAQSSGYEFLNTACPTAVTFHLKCGAVIYYHSLCHSYIIVHIQCKNNNMFNNDNSNNNNNYYY